MSINDSFMLKSALFYLLRKYFRQEAYYVDILDLFLEVITVKPRKLGNSQRALDGIPD